MRAPAGRISQIYRGLAASPELADLVLRLVYLDRGPKFLLADVLGAALDAAHWPLVHEILAVTATIGERSDAECGGIAQQLATVGSRLALVVPRDEVAPLRSALRRFPPEPLALHEYAAALRWRRRLLAFVTQNPHASLTRNSIRAVASLSPTSVGRLPADALDWIGSASDKATAADRLAALNILVGSGEGQRANSETRPLIERRINDRIRAMLATPQRRLLVPKDGPLSPIRASEQFKFWGARLHNCWANDGWRLMYLYETLLGVSNCFVFRSRRPLALRLLANPLIEWEIADLKAAQNAEPSQGERRKVVAYLSSIGVPYGGHFPECLRNCLPSVGFNPPSHANLIGDEEDPYFG